MQQRTILVKNYFTFLYGSVTEPINQTGVVLKLIALIYCLFKTLTTKLLLKVGGMCACRCSGSTAVRYGTMRENVLSLTVVLPNGDIVKTGNRARKSAAGYDLTHIFVGSEGTLGIVTEITLRVFKIPSVSRAMMVSFRSMEDAASAVQDTLGAGIQVGRAEMLDDTMIKIINEINGTSFHEATTVLFELAAEDSTAGERIG